MTRFFAILVLAACALLASSSVASADVGDYHPQGAARGEYHGAFEYFGGLQAAWIPAAAQDGGIGETTGPANSAKGCQSHF